MCWYSLARGMDLHVMENVINYDAPRATTTYTHRVGRTATVGLDVMDHAYYNNFETRSKQIVSQNFGILQWFYTQAMQKIIANNFTKEI